MRMNVYEVDGTLNIDYFTGYYCASSMKNALEMVEHIRPGCLVTSIKLYLEGVEIPISFLPSPPTP